jgi:hypothetical protein
MAALTMRSQRVAETTQCIWSSALILKDACTCLTAGANSPHRMNESKRSVILCLSGSRSAGLGRNVRSVLALALPLIGAKGNAKLIATGSSFPREETRQ